MENKGLLYRVKEMRKEKTRKVLASLFEKAIADVSLIPKMEFYSVSVNHDKSYELNGDGDTVEGFAYDTVITRR